MNQNSRCKWHISHPLGDGVYIMTCREDGKLRHALLYIHTFRLMAPRKLLEAQLFNKQYGCYEDINNIPDRCLQDWESGRKVVSLKSWEKYFKDKIST